MHSNLMWYDPFSADITVCRYQEMCCNIIARNYVFRLHSKYSFLTHWCRVAHICFSRLDHRWFRLWLVAWSAPSHYLNQSLNIVNWTLRNKRQWNFNRNSYIFIHGNAFKISTAKWQPFCLDLNVLTSQAETNATPFYSLLMKICVIRSRWVKIFV